MTLRSSLPTGAARALLVAGAALAALVAALLAGLSPAAAHEGAGVVAVEAAHPSGTSVHYIVQVTWQNDGHPAADATVTATPVQSDGTALTPVTLAPSGGADGRYQGTVEFPAAGSYTVRFTSVEPTGTAERPEEIRASAATSAGDEPTASSAATEGGFAPADDGTGGSATETADGGDEDIPVLLVVAAAVFALGGVVTALFLIRRYRPDLQAATAAEHDLPGGADRPAETDQPGAGDPGDAGTDTPSDTPAGAADAPAGGRPGDT